MYHKKAIIIYIYIISLGMYSMTELDMSHMEYSTFERKYSARGQFVVQRDNSAVR